MTALKPSLLVLPALALLAASGGLAHAQQDVRITQTGDNNKATTVQTGNQNTASVDIIGIDNGQINSTITQIGDGAEAEIYIEGIANNFNVTQIGSENKLYGNVYGSDNTFSVDQINANSDAYQNYGVVLQSGNNNAAALSQTVEALGASGGLNQSFITQYGNDNTATINQTGADNLAALTQDGNGNTGTINQVGVGLSAELNQFGDNLPGYTINQDCIIAACNQSIIVTQTAIGAGS